jgi:Fe-S-cluster containining protein
VEALYISQSSGKNLKALNWINYWKKPIKLIVKFISSKKDAYRDFKEGKDETAIFEKMAEERVRCPMLNDSDQCDIYEFRPITCRLYGIPTAIGGKGHTCGLSGFAKGKKLSDSQSGCYSSGSF